LKKFAADGKDDRTVEWGCDEDWLDVTIRFKDGAEHQVAIYSPYNFHFMEFGVEARNADTDAVLDTRSVQGKEPQYVVWNLKGNVKLHFKKVSGPLVAVSGIFFDPVQEGK